MIHKRPHDDEVVHEGACKHPRHWDNVDHFSSAVELVPANNGYPLSFSSGNESFGRSQGDGRLSDSSAQTVSCRSVSESEAGTSDWDSKFWWEESDIIGCDLDSVTALNLSFFPEFFAPSEQFESLLNEEECSSPLEYPSPSIGPEHQADIPEWRPRGNASDGADALHEERLLGTCVTSMPKLGLLSDSICQSSEHGRECCCPDQGSVRCIRKHVAEAREAMWRELGDDAFNALDFNDMGETVSTKWTEDEQDMFHEVVRSSPARLGKNFWVQLTEAFPSRTKKDLVSYYFNVFMLRKRTEQNRSVLLQIDSDDDECRSFEEEEDDSGLDSLTSQDTTTSHHQEDQTEIWPERIADAVDACKDTAVLSVHSCCQHQDETACSINDDYDYQNDSCVSSESDKDKQQRPSP